MRRAELKGLELFQRLIQSTERIADLIEFTLQDLLDPLDQEGHSERLCWFGLERAAEFLSEEKMNKMAEIAPEGYESLVRFYNLYAKACGEAADAIYHFLGDAVPICRVHAAFRVLKAHNDARDVYLESIDFPAWL